MKYYALLNNDGKVLAKFKRNPDTTEEWVFRDGGWKGSDSYVAGKLLNGDMNFVEVNV